jgi:hypothetical protein
MVGSINHTLRNLIRNHIKGFTMTVLGHSITWGTHVRAERTTGAKGLYTQVKTRWAAHKAARHEAAHTPYTATATDAMEPAHAHLITTALRDFGV